MQFLGELAPVTSTLWVTRRPPVWREDDFDRSWAQLAPALATYVSRYPQVDVELVVSDTIVDLIAERFDLSIRIGWLRGPPRRRRPAVRAPSFRARLRGGRRRGEDELR